MKVDGKLAKKNTKQSGSVSPEKLAQLMSAASGKEITGEMILDDIASGAPTAEDGSVRIAAYCAWLAREDRREG